MHSSSKSSKKNLGNPELSTNNNSDIYPLEQDIERWKNEASSFSYEEALNALELLLESLQNDSVPLEELQEYHLKGSIYLDHCQQLLDNAEQKVIEIDVDLLGK